MRGTAFLLLQFLPSAAAAVNCSSYWFEQQRHGFSYRSVASFGAVGDGVTDATAAFSAALDFNRGGDAGSNKDKAAAFVYVPAGTYLLSDTLVLWKWTKLAGNALCPPTLLLAPSAPGFGDPTALKPFFVTNDGFNSTASDHAWWIETPARGGATNENFFTQLHYVRIVISPGNPGAVALTWNVAQQTSIRFVSIDAGDGAIGLDVGAGRDYARWVDGSYNLGGGGVVEDIAIRNGGVGLRLAAAQFFLRNVTIEGSREVGMRAWQLGWSLVVLALRVGGTPLGVDVAGLAGALQLLDATFSRIGGGTAVRSDGASPVYLQNVVGDASVKWVLDGAHAPPVSALAQGRVFDGGRARAGGTVPLPPLAAARAGGVPLACGGGLCGGSAEDAATRVPHVPLPEWGADAGGEPIGNALEEGCRGDGERDDTAALAAALSKFRTLFLPFGIYKVSDTLTLRADGRLVGEGLSVLALAAGAPGFEGPTPKPLLAAPPGADVRVADVAIFHANCGNGGAVLLEWGGGPAASVHDFSMLVAAPAAAKAVVLGGAPGVGAGYWSNTWWVAAMSYIPSAALGRGGVVARRRRGVGAAPCDPYTKLGVISGGAGPLFLAGVNYEHSVEGELLLVAGATNHVVLGLQTEEAPVALSVNGTINAVAFGVLGAFWNASQRVPAAVDAVRPRPAAAGVFDVLYRLYGVAVPIANSDAALVIDSLWAIPAGSGFEGAAVVLNSGA